MSEIRDRRSKSMDDRLTLAEVDLENLYGKITQIIQQIADGVILTHDDYGCPRCRRFMGTHRADRAHVHCRMCTDAPSTAPVNWRQTRIHTEQLIELIEHIRTRIVGSNRTIILPALDMVLRDLKHAAEDERAAETRQGDA